jgi:hypothetical protein
MTRRGGTGDGHELDPSGADQGQHVEHRRLQVASVDLVAAGAGSIWCQPVPPFVRWEHQFIEYDPLRLRCLRILPRHGGEGRGPRAPGPAPSPLGVGATARSGWSSAWSHWDYSAAGATSLLSQKRRDQAPAAAALYDARPSRSFKAAGDQMGPQRGISRHPSVGQPCSSRQTSFSAGADRLACGGAPPEWGARPTPPHPTLPPRSERSIPPPRRVPPPHRPGRHARAARRREGVRSRALARNRWRPCPVHHAVVRPPPIISNHRRRPTC